MRQVKKDTVVQLVERGAGRDNNPFGETNFHSSASEIMIKNVVFFSFNFFKNEGKHTKRYSVYTIFTLFKVLNFIFF